MRDRNVQEEIFRKENFWVEIDLGGGAAPGGTVLVGELSGGKLFEGICPGGNLPRTVFYLTAPTTYSALCNFIQSPRLSA